MNNIIKKLSCCFRCHDYYTSYEYGFTSQYLGGYEIKICRKCEKSEGIIRNFKKDDLTKTGIESNNLKLSNEKTSLKKESINRLIE